MGAQQYQNDGGNQEDFYDEVYLYTSPVPFHPDFLDAYH